MLELLIIATTILTLVYFLNKELTATEFLMTVGAVILTMSLVFSLQFIKFPNDKYFMSGRIMKTAFYPAWVEEYEQSHERCEGEGEDEHCETYYTTEHAHHSPYWMMYDSLGQEWEIDSQLHAQIKSYFGNHVIVTQPNKCTHGGHFDGGDPNLYTYKNETNIYKYPTHKTVMWHNPIKGTHSLFNEGSDNYEREYPKSLNSFSTNRLLASKYTSDITPTDIDIFNTKIFEAKGVNMVIADAKDMQECTNLEAYWNGGEYNDIDICLVGDFKNPDNVKVFGWVEDPILKKDIETIILDKGFVKSSLQLIEQKIIEKYQPIDWKQFDYIKRDCPVWISVLGTILSIIVSIICVIYFSDNYDRRE